MQRLSGRLQEVVSYMSRHIYFIKDNLLDAISKLRHV